MTWIKKVHIGFAKEIYVSCLTFLAYTMVGVCRGYTTFIISQLREPDSDIDLTQNEESWLASLTILPDPVGCLLGGLLVDTIGRKKALISIFIPFSIAWLIISLATNTWMLYIGTIFNGIASGMTFNSATYIAEMCRPENRGFLLTLLEPTFSSGVLFCNLIVCWLKWKMAAAVYLGLSIICFCLFFLLPESPMYLMGKNRKQEATAVIRWMRGKDANIDQEVTDIDEFCKNVNSRSKDWSSVLQECVQSWKPLLILCGLNLLQQASGYQIIVAYTTVFFDEMNIPFDNSTAVILYSTMGLIASFVTPFIAYYYGRKTLLAYSGLGMGLSLCVASIYETLFLDDEDKSFYWVVLVSVYAYSVSLMLGVMILTFVLCGELFRAEVRGVMCGVNGGLSYLMIGLILKGFPYFLNKFGIVVTLWTFTICSLLHVPYAIFVLPETRGKTLNEIQSEYFS